MNKNFNEILIINASAGSGKTYQLTLRYLSLLFLGAHPSKILAVTFTKKAAKEMRERITQTLSKLQNGEIGESDPLYLQIKEVYEGNIRVAARKALDIFLASNNKISTIDSFVHQILRKFCFYASVRHDFELLEQNEEELKRRFLEALDEKEAFIKYLLNKKESVEKILSLFGYLYAEEGDLARFEKKFENYDRGYYFGVAKSFLQEANRFYAFLNSKKPSKFPDRLFKTPHEFLSAHSFEKLITERESLSSHRDYKALSNGDSEALFLALKVAFAAYLEAKADDTIAFLLHSFSFYKRVKTGLNKEKNALGFDDVSKIVKELLEEGRVDSDFLYFRLDGEIDHILIDEFQDTSVLQFRIIRPLLDEILSGVGAGEFKSFFLVGDPKQSIYRFRGAAAGMFENASNYVKSKAEGRYKELRLGVNYRSFKAPVEFANGLFSPLYKGLFEPQQSAASKSGFAQTKLVLEEELLEGALCSVKEFLKAGAKPEEITILAYTNDDVEDIASFLEENGIKTQKESSKSLAEDEEVAAILSFLEYSALKNLRLDPTLAAFEFMVLAQTNEEEFEKFADKTPPFLAPANIAFAVAREFGFASANVMRLIELASSYEDSFSFLNEKSANRAQKLSAKISGVNIMTAHKSKGLEFEYCIVCDTLKKRDGKSAPPILLEYENFKLSNIIVASKSAKLMLGYVKEAMEIEERAMALDLLNANYVAMTRAKKGICVVGKIGGFSRFSDLGLVEGVLGEKVFERAIESEDKNKGYGGELLGLSLGAQNDFIRDDSYAPNDYKAIDFGLAMHSYFESLDFFKDGADAKCFVQNRYGIKLGESLEYLYLVADNFEGLKRLVDDKKERPIILKEVGVCVEKGGVLRLFRIDALFIYKDRAVIVDFKSSSEIREGYKKQIREYMEITSSILNLPIEAYLTRLQNDKLELVSI